jgi:hypothetical protein
VDVVATAPLVENTASSFTTEVQQNYVQEIPLAGRDIQALAQFLPGFTQSSGPSGSLFGFNRQFGGFPDPLHLIGSGISLTSTLSGMRCCIYNRLRFHSVTMERGRAKISPVS